MAVWGDDGALTHDRARRVYNRIGRLQDWQGFYEKRPLAALVGHARFDTAAAVFELGCGTGSFADELLARHIGDTATYAAVDLSDKMVRLATRRLARWGSRCRVERVDGSLPFGSPSAACDRFVSAYVFDLLGAEYAAAVLDEAHRMLRPGGLLCTVGLTHTGSGLGRVVSRSWDALWRRVPGLVGGCRPVSVAGMLDDRWRLDHREVVVSWGVPSEVMVATRI